MAIVSYGFSTPYMLCDGNIPIDAYIIKLDLDAAYRCLHKIAYILLRLPFGVVNIPNNFILLSEPIMDLTHDILRDDKWDPAEIHSP